MKLWEYICTYVSVFLERPWLSSERRRFNEGTQGLLSEQSRGLRTTATVNKYEDGGCCCGHDFSHSALSFPSTPLCEGIHWKHIVTLLVHALSTAVSTVSRMYCPDCPSYVPLRDQGSSTSEVSGTRGKTRLSTSNRYIHTCFFCWTARRLSLSV